MSDDIRAALSAAMDAAEAEPTETPAVETAEVATAPEAPAAAEAEPAEAETPAAAAQRARDEAGRFARKAPEGKATAVAPKVVKPTAPAPAAPKPPTPEAAIATPAPEAPKAPVQPELRAPQSWKPQAREHWQKLPPEVQQEVVRREREAAIAIQQAAPARQLAEDFQRMLEPYRALLTDEPLKVVGGLLQTAAQLQTAPPAHKARLVANIIQSYGVPVDALAAALEGGQGGAPQAAPAHVDPANLAAQVRQQVMQDLQRQRQAAEAQKAQSEVEAFVQSAPEFLEDVREDMADLMEVASRRGQTLSIQDAYTRALKMHPEVSRVLEQRQRAQAATAQQAATQKARAAASSVRTQPASGPSAPKPADLRSALEQAWDEASGR